MYDSRRPQLHPPDARRGSLLLRERANLDVGGCVGSCHARWLPGRYGPVRPEVDVFTSWFSSRLWCRPRSNRGTDPPPFSPAAGLHLVPRHGAYARTNPRQTVSHWQTTKEVSRTLFLDVLSFCGIQVSAASSFSTARVVWMLTTSLGPLCDRRGKHSHEFLGPVSATGIGYGA